MTKNIDLSRIPPPPVVKDISFDEILSHGMEIYVQEMLPQNADAIEKETVQSEPVMWILRAMSSEVLRIYQQINEGAEAVMLPTSTGKDLDVLGRNFGVTRLLLQKSDKENGVADDIWESDNRFRYRIQKALEGLTTAGSVNAYEFHASSVSVEKALEDEIIVESVKDVSVDNPTPGTVVVTILSSLNHGEPSQKLITAVHQKLNREDIRPLTDEVIVCGPELVPYEISANLDLDDGPESLVAIERAKCVLDKYTKDQHRLGKNITISGIYASLHQPGVNNVSNLNILEDIKVKPNQAAYCTGIQIAR